MLYSQFWKIKIVVPWKLKRKNTVILSSAFFSFQNFFGPSSNLLRSWSLSSHFPIDDMAKHRGVKHENKTILMISSCNILQHHCCTVWNISWYSCWFQFSELCKTKYSSSYWNWNWKMVGKQWKHLVRRKTYAPITRTTDAQWEKSPSLHGR